MNQLWSSFVVRRKTILDSGDSQFGAITSVIIICDLETEIAGAPSYAKNSTPN